jgi:hypothetical protein
MVVCGFGGSVGGMGGAPEMVLVVACGSGDDFGCGGF